jgi:mRNA deadenylase 3'-5' endonuclease subunit Ccr4
MQNVFEENINFIKIICTAALIYLAYRGIGSLFEIKGLLNLGRILSFLKNKKNDSSNLEKIPDSLSIEIKNNKSILFKIPQENSHILRETNINSYNFTPIINKFSIFTYNILCQKFMMRRDRKDLSLENRMERIKEQIAIMDPDIICLQECVFHSIKLHLESFLSNNYEIYYIENYGSNFYNLTAFKKEKFELKENKKINLNDIKVEGNRGIYCLELNIKNKHNHSRNQAINSNLAKNNNSDIKKDEKTKVEFRPNLNSEEKSNYLFKLTNTFIYIDKTILPKEKQVENSNTGKNSTNRINSNYQAKSSKPNKNKERTQNFFYNYRNFIEYNKAENKNKLVIYNVHFPWKPIFDFEKCLILNKIADDVISKNQRNYIIIGDFNSKPNSLLMRMIYLENFINEIKYFKNIINFKSDYFKKRNSEEMNKNEKIAGFHDYNYSPNKSTKTKYNFINTEKIENLVEKTNKKNNKSNDEADQNVNELISNFDILKELKDMKNNSTEKKSNRQNNKKTDNKNLKDLETPSNIVVSSCENNDSFWTKLSEQKHQENVCNKKIKDFDILKELFYLNVKLEKERHNFTFDSIDKTILKEILKLLTLSENKKIFQDVFSNQNLNEINNNCFNNPYYQMNNLQTYNTSNVKSKYLIDNSNSNLYSNLGNNYINSYQINQDFYYHQNNYKTYLDQNLQFNSFNGESNYNQNIIENNLNSLDLGISISNDNYIKIRNMIDNFKNLFVKYKFRSAYDSYQIENSKNKVTLNFIEKEKIENVSEQKLLELIRITKKNEADNKSKDIKNVNSDENTSKKSEIDNNKNTKSLSNISDYFKNHPLYTNFTDNFKDTIDYIFYSKYLIVDKILKLPDYSELISEDYLPSSKYPSDHLPLYAEFFTN